MKRILVLIVILFVAVVAFFIFEPTREQSQIQKLDKITPKQYQEIAQDLKRQIDNLSPTPPTEDDWIVTNIEFAKDSNLAYVTYHDTHNIFRILVEIGRLENNYHYKVKATFEKTLDDWKLTHGEDKAADLELIEVK